MLEFPIYQPLQFNRGCDEILVRKDSTINAVFNSKWEIKAVDDFNDITTLPTHGNVLNAGETLFLSSITSNYKNSYTCGVDTNSRIYLYTFKKLIIFSVVPTVIDDVVNEYDVVYDTEDMTIVNISKNSGLEFVYGISNYLKSQFIIDSDFTIVASGSNLEITFLTAKLGYTTIEVLGSSPASATPVLHWGFRTYWNRRLRSLVAWNEGKHLDSCGWGGKTDATFYVRNWQSELINEHKKSCRIRFKIRSMIEDVAFDYKFKLVTSGGDILAEQTVNVPANIELEYQNIFILPATPFNLDNLQLISGDSKPAGSEWSGKDDLFYIKDVEIATKDDIAKIDLYNCEGVKIVDDYNATINQNEDETTSVIELPYNSNMASVVITSVQGDIYQSNAIKYIDYNANDKCFKDLLPLKWSNSCRFANTDYGSLEIEHEIFIRAFLMYQELRDLETEFITTHAGKEKMLFYVSNENYELRIANYTQVIHSIVQYALLHNILYLGGEKYFRNQNSKYTLAEYNNGYFTAKIQLSKDDSTLIVRNGCC